jgi:hypothetical protein
MTKLDYYERHLLALSVQACADRGLQICPIAPRGWKVSIWTGLKRTAGYGDTLADALTALLTDLGVPVPERPSEEAVREWLSPYAWGDDLRVPVAYLRDLHARDPLLAAAVLEAGR